MPFLQLSQHLPFGRAPTKEKQAYRIHNLLLDFAEEPVEVKIVRTANQDNTLNV